MKKGLYDTFADRWFRGGNIWFYSDPHFNDPDSKQYRKGYIGDDEQVKRINSKIGKNDTVIFLGDIGDLSYIKKIRGYKVLIAGNHDTGLSNYKKVVKYEHKLGREISDNDWESYKWTLVDPTPVGGIYERTEDNNLFDEVYEGTLQIGPHILLSHEEDEKRDCINLCGHTHSIDNFFNKLFSNYDCDMSTKEYIKAYLKESIENNRICFCAEHINYTPISLTQLLDLNFISNLPDIHRLTIDKASERKQKKLKY